MYAIHSLRQQGITTAANLARALNERGITTPRAHRWHVRQVQRVITTGMTRAQAAAAQGVRRNQMRSQWIESMRRQPHWSIRGTGRLAAAQPDGRPGSQGVNMSNTKAGEFERVHVALGWLCPQLLGHYQRDSRGAHRDGVNQISAMFVKVSPTVSPSRHSSHTWLQPSLPDLPTVNVTLPS